MKYARKASEREIELEQKYIEKIGQPAKHTTQEEAGISPEGRLKF